MANASLKITSPEEGTVVHPGDTLVVDVSASGGPYEWVSAFSWDLRGGDMLEPTVPVLIRSTDAKETRSYECGSDCESWFIEDLLAFGLGGY